MMCDTYLKDTMSKSIDKTCADGSAEASKEALVHDVLAQVADKWTLMVIDALGEAPGTLRFTELMAAVKGVSQKMLTRTLRDLERDGLVTRKVHAVVPPRVDYGLTKLGHTLGEALCSIWLWVEDHADDVRSARRAFERRQARTARAPQRS